MKSLKYILFIAGLTGGFFSCKREVLPIGNVELGWDYAPLEVGKYIIYDVDSLIYNDFALRTDTVHLEVKDSIREKFIDNEGRESYIVDRTKRYDVDQEWQNTHTFYLTKDSFKLEWQENNLRFIKMIYPVKINSKWSGNTYMATLTNPELRWYDGWEYRYTAVEKPLNTGFKKYPKTVEVLQVDEAVGDSTKTDAYSTYTYSREIFAKNVGMVQKELTHWEYQPSGNQYRKGFSLIMRAKANN